MPSAPLLCNWDRDAAMSLLQLDYTNCLAQAIGATHGLNDNEMETLIAKIPKHHEHIQELAADATSALFSLPEQKLDDVEALLKQHQKKWKQVIVLGVGGSMLGAQCLVQSLAHEHYNIQDHKQRGGPQIIFLDNADPHSVQDTFDILDLKKTLFVFITKSGITAEAIAFFLHIQAQLESQIGKTALAKQCILCTHKEKSPLSSYAEQLQCAIIDTPKNLGDRFNILGTPSLFIAGLCGIDMHALLDGARSMKQRCWHGEANKNPAYMHALVHYLLTRKRRKTIHATMGFSNRLRPVIQWYEHVLSVSLGKMLNKKGKAVHVGPSHTSCIGPSGLHGQMQLYAEGPFDKVVTFLCVRNHGADFSIPTIQSENDAINYMGGSQFADIGKHAYVTAAQCMTDAGRPNMTIHLDAIDERCLGGLIFMLELSTVMSAELYGIDAFDQPGVESNKQGLFAQLGRIGFEDKAHNLAAYQKRPTHTC